MQRHSVLFSCLCIIALMLTQQRIAVAGSELYPAEFTVLPAGTQLASFFYYHRMLDGYYADGKRFGDAKVLGQAMVGVYTRYDETWGMPSAWTFVLPYIHAERTEGVLPQGFGNKATGVSDIRLTYNIWPINNPEKGYSLAVSTNVNVPTGEYNDDQALNPGDNRWVGTLQLGWIQKLNSSLYLDFTPEAKFFGTNHDYVGFRMKQAPIYALTSYLRWQFKPGWEASIGGQWNHGGDQEIEGFDLNNATQQQRYFLALRSFISNTQFLSVRYSQDTRAENDLKISSDIVLRYSWFF